MPTPIRLFKDSGRFFRNAEEMFAITSWVQVMLGQHIVPRHYHPAVDLVPDREIAGLIDSVKTVIAACVDAMPTHAQFIARHCAAHLRFHARNEFRAGSLAAILSLAACSALQPAAPPKLLQQTDTPNGAGEFLEDIEHRTFDFFWANANPKNGLVPDRYPTRHFRERRRGRVCADGLSHRG